MGRLVAPLVAANPTLSQGANVSEKHAVIDRLDQYILKAIDENWGGLQILQLCEARAWVISPVQSHSSSSGAST